MSNESQRTLATYWFCSVAVLCIGLVGATALNVLGTLSGPTAWLLSKITLTNENNVGAWWSGMLLALLSLHAYDGYALLRRSEPGAARGWMLLAAVLLFLSFDEIGSIHERLGQLSRALSLGSWSLMLSVGAVLAAMFFRALTLLWRAQCERRKVRWIVLGFCLLGSVALQEILEHRINWQTDAARAVRAAVEEGTELLGMLILLRVALANTVELASRSTGATAFAALYELRTPLVAIGLALTPALALGSAALTDQQYRGHPADWPAAVGFLAAGLVFWRPFFTDGRGGRSWAALIAGGLCCLASLTAVEIAPPKLVEFGPVDVSLRMVVMVAISFLLGAALACLPDGKARLYAAGAVVVSALAAALLPFPNLALVYALSQLLGLVTYWVTATIGAAKARPAARHVFQA